ncbi:MAG: glycerate kinase [Bacteroidetes bacterium HGW-Bacteroidetes-7]|jgi:glycerate kinase|nr:MAG: glycerate kinase [Bacteroidetes bacterium HGW-Bacteroidetes-7]
MMKVLILVDKFRGSLSASEVSEAIAIGLQSFSDNLDIVKVPLADGGEGTLEAVERDGTERLMIECIDPLGREIVVPVLKMGDRILIEMAKSTGLHLLTREERNPLYTSSYGLGLVIKKVSEMGFKNILIGIGGSATNDGGAGMLEALGFRFVDEEGRDVRLGEHITGRDLINIRNVDDSGSNPLLKELNIEVASDVTNTLVGAKGASRVYGPQKGAGEVEVEYLEKGMQNFAKVSADYHGKDFSSLPGSGAAGGVGFGLIAYCGATLKNGWRVLFDFMDVDKSIMESHLVITGEGRVDEQSLSGKLLAGVGELCKKHKKPLWIICGDNHLANKDVRKVGASILFAISYIEPEKELAIKNAREYLEKISADAATFLKDIQSNNRTNNTK